MDGPISLTIPSDNPTAIRAAAVFFSILSGDTIAPDVDLVAPGGVGWNDDERDCSGPVYGYDPETEQYHRFPDGTVLVTEEQYKAAMADVASVFVDPVTEEVATSAPTGVALDEDGLPHDVRIHSKNATKNGDGRWKRKRGVEPDLYKQVVEELRAVMAIQSPGSTTQTPPPPPPAPTQVQAPPPPAPTQVQAPPPPPTAAASPSTDYANRDWLAEPPTNFTELCHANTWAIADKRIAMDGINAALNAEGLPNMVAVQVRPDLIPAVWAGVVSRLGAPQ